MNETNMETARQINAKELKFAGFKLFCDDNKNMISMMKGKKIMRITYNYGTDLYDVTRIKIKGLATMEEEQLNGIYGDQLREMITSFFPNFEYVMDSIKIVGVNC